MTKSSEPLTSIQLETTLQGFTGSEQFYQIYPGLVITEGSDSFATRLNLIG